MGIFSFLEKKVSMAELQEAASVVASGIAPQAHFKELALQIATSYIANTISKCEFMVYENGKETQNELYYMLNVSPNPNQNSSQFLNALVTRYFYKGEVLVYPDDKRGRLYVADGFSREDKPMGEHLYSNVTVETETLRRKFKASEVFYFRLDDKMVKRLIDGTFEQYGPAMQSAIDCFLRNNGKKYKLILDQYNAGSPEFREMFENVIKKQLDTFMRNQNTVYPQFRGTNLEEFGSGVQGNSADVIAMRKEIFDMVAQAFKIPLSMMYGNITNIKDMINMFLTFTIDPLADMISEEITRKMYPFKKWKDGNYVKLDTSRISHVDILDCANNVSTALASGAVRVDEMRKRLDMEPYGDEFGSMRFVTRNYATTDEILKGENEAKGVNSNEAEKQEVLPAGNGGE